MFKTLGFHCHLGNLISLSVCTLSSLQRVHCLLWRCSLDRDQRNKTYFYSLLPQRCLGTLSYSSSCLGVFISHAYPFRKCMLLLHPSLPCDRYMSRSSSPHCRLLLFVIFFFQLSLLLVLLSIFSSPNNPYVHSLLSPWPNVSALAKYKTVLLGRQTETNTYH